MSVTPRSHVMQNPYAKPILIAVIVIVIVSRMPAAQVHQTFADVITLVAMIMGASVPAAKYSNRQHR